MKLVSVLCFLAAAAWSGGMPAAGAAALPASPVIAAPALTGTRDLGPAANTRVDVTVVLPYQHATELPYLVRAQGDPASKYFRRFLRAADFQRYFSPTPAAYESAALALKAAGLSVTTAPNRTVLHASGSAAAVERFFHTTIHMLRQADGRIAYSNVTSAVVPAALGGARVVGLSNVITVKLASSQRRPTRRPAVAVGGALFGPDGGFGPSAIAQAEDFPVEHGYRGANSNVADLIDGPVSDSDVAGFLTQFGIKRTGPRTTAIAVDGGCRVACYDGFSAAIDAEWIVAMAPGASLFTYQVPELTNGFIVDGFNAIVSDDAVNIVNVSFGSCEVSGADLELALEPIVAQGAAEGISFESVAFGGAGLCGLPPLVLPMSPANLDTVTAVGGSSTFDSAAGVQLDATAYYGSNGGVSGAIPLPPWQTGDPGIVSTGRNVPDLVLPSSVDGVGPSIYYGGAWLGGATFVNNAPFAGYLASVQELYGYTTPIGNVAPALYAVRARTGYAKSFADITLGCIGASGSVPVCAKTNYDLATGIGSIADGYVLAKALGFGPVQPPAR